MIKFSFIIPVYNVKDYVAQCIESILSQTYKNYEIILVDDGSTDGSGDICDKYAQKDNRIRVIHQRNQGNSVARNKAVELSKGEYIIFLDSDDYWIADKLDVIAANCKDNDLVVFNYETYDEKAKEIICDKNLDLNNIVSTVTNGEQYIQKIFENNKLYGWYAWFYAIKRDLILDFKFESNIKYEDVELMYKIILNARKVCVVDHSILRYRLNRQGSITQNVKLDTEKDKLEVVKRNISNIQKMDISDYTKKILCNDFSCLYYSSLILCNDIKNKIERDELIKKLKESMWVCEYTTNTEQKTVYKIIKIIGLKATSKLLNIRRIIKK